MFHLGDFSQSDNYGPGNYLKLTIKLLNISKLFHSVNVTVNNTTTTRLCTGFAVAGRML